MLPVAKFESFEEAEKAEREYYRGLSPAQRLEIVFQLREMAHKEENATPQRLARVYRISELSPR